MRATQGSVDALDRKAYVPHGPDCDLTYTVTDVQAWRGDQSLHAVVHCTAAGDGKPPKRLRVTIKRDAYDFQSRATVEMWASEGWVLAYRRHAIDTLPIYESVYVTRDDREWVQRMQLSSVALLLAWEGLMLR